MISFPSHPSLDVLFSPTPTPAESVVDILAGSRRTTFGHVLPETLAPIVDWYTSTNEPIRLLSMYGAGKLYGRSGAPDLLDLLALRRLWALDQAVRQLYPKGLEFELVVEDLTEDILAPGRESQSAELDYRRGLESLARLLGLRLYVVPESSILPCLHDEFMSHVTENTEHMVRRILGQPEELERLGWSGQLGTEMLDDLRRRAGGELLDCSTLELDTRVAKYLAVGLARRQVSLFERFGPVVKASFARLPTGVDPSLYRGRVEYKLWDSKSNHSVTPWAGAGVLDANGTVRGMSFREWTTVGPTPTVVPVCRTNAVDTHDECPGVGTDTTVSVIGWTTVHG